MASPAQPQQPVPASSNLALTAMILGILGILCSILAWATNDIAVIGLIGAFVFGLVGLILGAVALKKKQNRAWGLTGLITGILSVLSSIILFIMVVIVAAMFIGAFAGM